MAQPRAKTAKMVARRQLSERHEAVLAIEARRPIRLTMSRVGRALRIFFVVVVLVATAFLLNIIQLLALPLNLASRRLYHRVSSFAAGLAWGICQYLVESQDNVRLSFSGVEKIPRHESAFVISNHAYFGDFFLIHTLAGEKQMLGNCRYFAKDSVKYIPFFGWGMYLCNMPFLKRNWLRDSKRIYQALSLFITYKLPVWLVSHVEGSRITPSKLALSQEYAREHNLPLLEHVLLPRCKGFVATLQAIRESHVKFVYDITLAYFHPDRGFGATPSPWELLTGGLDAYEMHAHVDRIPIEKIPADESLCSTWLYDLYIQKDELMRLLKDAFEKESKIK